MRYFPTQYFIITYLAFRRAQKRYLATPNADTFTLMDLAYIVCRNAQRAL